MVVHAIKMHGPQALLAALLLLCLPRQMRAAPMIPPQYRGGIDLITAVL
jgi:hypothetical protein